MRVLVSGAGGFIGRACVAGFAEAGWQVRAISRRLVAAQSGVEPVLLADFASADWGVLLHEVDCVLHLVGVAHQPGASVREYDAINIDMTADLARASVASGVRHFVYLSSIAVHGRGSGMIEESSPLCPTGAYGRSKAVAEALLRDIARDTSLRWTVVRPPLVYGPHAPGNFRRLAGLVSLGLPLPLAAATAPRSYIGIDNLVSALLCIVGNAKAANRTYLVSDNDDMGSAELIRTMACGAGRRARLWWLPLWLLRFVAAALGRSGDAERLFGRLQLDTHAIRRELGWTPDIPAREGIISALSGDADGL